MMMVYDQSRPNGPRTGRWVRRVNVDSAMIAVACESCNAVTQIVSIADSHAAETGLTKKMGPPYCSRKERGPRSGGTWCNADKSAVTSSEVMMQ